MMGHLGKIAGAALLVALALPARGAPPLARTISIDGDLSDWSEVLANPANVSHDGDGSTVACAQSTDRATGVGVIAGKAPDRIPKTPLHEAHTRLREHENQQHHRNRDPQSTRARHGPNAPAAEQLSRTAPVGSHLKPHQP